MSDEISIHDLKARARSIARSGPLTYCQALDEIARRRGFPHWKALSSENVRSSDADTSRRVARKINDWIGSAIREGSTEDDALLLLTDPTMPSDRRRATALRLMAPLPDDPESVAISHAAGELCAILAHLVLSDGVRSLLPPLWEGRRPCSAAFRDAVASAAGGQTADPDSRLGSSLPAAACSLWLAAIREAAETSSLPEDHLAGISTIEGAHPAFLRSVLSLLEKRLTGLSSRLPTAPSPPASVARRERAAFERMVAERYLVRAGGQGADHLESARINVDQFLSDEGVSFGDPKITWGRPLANRIADDDMAAWPDFV